MLEKRGKSSNKEPLADLDLTLGRKCKAGISWVTMKKTKDRLINRIHIHFLLDGINQAQVIDKQGKYITGKELRWLYRHRHHPLVAKKVQFWMDNKPTLPPWTGFGSSDWSRYMYHDYSKFFSELFNIP
ncbi:hypothetical protein [Xenorhabdus mauleonii]|uniref:hypothetical protein n=1 Tax=Xenorhabdus mauleonii TaxID=351675 RepID=UPI000B859208|nr:hypothetical protein [Xenorhabdus mauleonii]